MQLASYGHVHLHITPMHFHDKIPLGAEAGLLTQFNT
jgi:hypothetical protein